MKGSRLASFHSTFYGIITHNLILCGTTKKEKFMEKYTLELAIDSNYNLQDFIKKETAKAQDFSNITATEFLERFQKFQEEERQNAFSKKIKIASIDYDGEKDLFLSSFDSLDTRDAYCRSLNRAEEYAETLEISLLEFTPAQADNFIYSLKERSPLSIRRDAAAVSSFFTFLERRHDTISNPFRGTKARPSKKTVREEAYPSTEEVDYIVDHMSSKELSAIVYIMAHRGLRVGAFQNLSIKDGRFKTLSKNKEYRGELSSDILDKLKEAGVNLYSPFKDYDTVSLKSKIKYEIEKMYLAGNIKAPYSAHDFRHFFAATEYLKDKDIYRVCKLLNHANIAVTENYLKGLNVLV